MPLPHRNSLEPPLTMVFPMLALLSCRFLAMSRHFLAPMLLLLCSCSLLPQGIKVSAKMRSLKGADDCPLAAYELYDGARPDTPSRAWFFFVPGSERRPVLGAVEKLAGAVALGARVVLLERRGVDRDGKVNEAIALAGSNKLVRVNDQCRVLDSYLADIGKGMPVVLVGASEGGDVACAVAARMPQVTHLVLIDCAGGWCQADELRFLLRQHGKCLGLERQADLEAAFRLIRAEPDNTRLWAGHPHCRWSSFLWSRPLDDLLGLDLPIFLSHGDRDTSVPVESARAVVAALEQAGKNNLTYHEYQGCEHGMRRCERGTAAFPLLEADLIDWFAGHGVLTPSEAKAAAARVWRAHPELFTDQQSAK